MWPFYRDPYKLLVKHYLELLDLGSFDKFLDEKQVSNFLKILNKMQSDVADILRNEHDREPRYNELIVLLGNLVLLLNDFLQQKITISKDEFIVNVNISLRMVSVLVQKELLPKKEYDEIIASLPKDERNAAVKLKVPNPYVMLEGLVELDDSKSQRSIPLVKEVVHRILGGSFSQSLWESVGKIALIVLKRLEFGSKVSLIEYLLQQDNSDIKTMVISFLIDKKINNYTNIIINLLSDENAGVRKHAIAYLGQNPSKDTIFLIKPLVKDKDQQVRSTAIMVLSGLSDDIKHHALYSQQEPEFFEKGRKILRKKLEKTGGETVLLGGELVGKVVIKVINEQAFLAWKKAFESVDVWLKSGFDYIPVEPILMKNGRLRARKIKSGAYEVATVVLGPTMWSFLNNSANSKFERELNEQRKNITLVLEDNLRIYHGHIHNTNFCVKLYEDKPRLYIIDFDLARII